MRRRAQILSLWPRNERIRRFTSISTSCDASEPNSASDSLFACSVRASWRQWAYCKGACRSKLRSWWPLMPWATRQCCDYRSAGEEAKCWDCYSQCFASARTEIVIMYIFRKVNGLVETFCKVTNLKVEKLIAVWQAYGHYLICFLAWVVIFTKKALEQPSPPQSSARGQLSLHCLA